MGGPTWPARGRTAAGDRLRRLSLRWRLVAVLLALLLVSCAIVAAATTLALRRFLLDRLDQQLAAAGDRYSVYLEHPSDGDGDESGFGAVVGQAAGTLGARLAGDSVTAIGVVSGGDDHRTPTAADRVAIAKLTVTNRPRSVSLPGLGEYRVLVRAGRDGDLLVTGLPEDGVRETIGRLAVTEAIVFTGALLLTGVAGAICVRLSLRPLRRVAGTALAVSDLPLGSGAVSMPDRVPNPEPGTELGQVTVAFNHMLEHIESALGQRHASEDRLRHFVADAGHELRTPVAVIRSHAEYAQRAGGELPAAVGGALRRIGAESDRMGRLVEDLLLLARLDSGRPLVRDDVDLTRLAIDAVSDARVAGAGHRWQLDLPERPMTVLGDDHALHQALANLLANAATHTPAGTTVVTELREHTGAVELRVCDDGPGIPPDIRAHVFERFVRADASRSRPQGSTGLGLSIVDAIVRAHGGSADVNSRPGRTVFTIRLRGVVTAATAAADIRPVRR